MARTPKAPEPEPLVECIDTFCSDWVEKHALQEFPLFGCVKRGTLLRESHPVAKQHPQMFEPARAKGEPREEAA